MRFVVKSVEQILGVFSARTWCALVVVSVTGGSLVYNHYRQRKEELLQRVVVREKTGLSLGPITNRLPKSFQLIKRKEGVFILDMSGDSVTSKLSPVVGLPRFQCPFPTDKQVSKLTFANAVLLGLAHDPVVYFYFDELLRSDAVDDILDHCNTRNYLYSSPLPSRPSLMDVFSVHKNVSSDESLVSNESDSSVEGTDYYIRGRHNGGACVQGRLYNGRPRSLRSITNRPRLLTRAKDLFLQVWNSPLRSSPSKDSLRAMEHGIDPTAVLRAVKLYSKREHPGRACESIEDFVWLLLNGIADEVSELERQLEMVEERELTFRDCVMGHHDVSLWCLECGRFCLTETDSITVTYDKLLNEDLCDPLDKSIRKCIDKRRNSLSTSFSTSTSSSFNTSNNNNTHSSNSSSFFDDDGPCKHAHFRCLSCVSSRLSSVLTVYVPNCELASFPLSHSLTTRGVHEDRTVVYDLQLVIYCTNLLTGKDPHRPDVCSESYSCAFKNANNGLWYFFDGHDNYYLLPSRSERELKRALHFSPATMLMYTSRDWPAVREEIRKAWTRPRKALSGTSRQSPWKECLQSAKRALSYAGSL